MITDFLTTLAENLPVSAAATNGPNSYDLGIATTPFKRLAGEPLSVVVTVDVAAAGAGNGFVFKVLASTSANLATPVVVIQVPVPKADLIAGALIELPIPAHAPDRQFLGFQADVTAGDTVTVTASIMPRSFVQSYFAYRKGYTG